MKNLLLILILIPNVLTCFSQSKFENALMSLENELEFKPSTGRYLTSDKPNENFVKQFKDCTSFEDLEKLDQLDFNNIIKVRSSELFTSIWKGKWQIIFREWEFNSEAGATEFVKVLDDLSLSLLQVCVNKGGIMWWKEENRIYLVTSRAYFVTYHYEEIKEAIIKGLHKN